MSAISAERSSSDVPVSVVVPTYNEAESIATLIERVVALGDRYRVVVVDDSSPDGTATIVRTMADRFPGRVELLSRPKKEGIGRAYVSGFRHVLRSNVQLIAQMDADLSHNPNDLARLVAAADAADLVLGSRYVAGGDTRGWPRHRRLISKIGGRYARLVLGVPIRDLTGGFKVYRRTALEALDIDAITSDGYVFQIETTYKTLLNGFRVVEAPIHFVDRVAGKSKLSRRIVLEATLVVWKLKFQKLLGHL
ncbi:MAG TPA: polyprenol monophosphomannose synthase [Thermomicrobiales bacterium]|nr:polyprenol monophosphomannose synthase [Thermomicrobiales bacterium]